MADYLELPMEEARAGTRALAAMYLNPPQEIPTEQGHLKDWRGVATLRDFRQIHIDNFDLDASPTEAMWRNWNNYSLGQRGGKVRQFIDILNVIDRPDVIQAITPSLMRDWSCYMAHFELPEEPEQVNQVSSASDPQEDDDEDMLLVGDVRGQPKPMRDAIISYADTPGDLELARQWTEKLESPPYNLRILFVDRDLLGGGDYYTLMAASIRKRCRTVLVLLTNNWLKSPMCDFQVRFAHCLSPGARSKCLIPVLLETDLSVPDVLLPQFHLDYTNVHKRPWFWTKVVETIKAAPPSLEFRKDVRHLSCTMSRTRRPASNRKVTETRDGDRESAGGAVGGVSMGLGSERIYPDVPTAPPGGLGQNEEPSSWAVACSQYDPIPRAYRAQATGDRNAPYSHHHSAPTPLSGQRSAEATRTGRISSQATPTSLHHTARDDHPPRGATSRSSSDLIDAREPLAHLSTICRKGSAIRYPSLPPPMDDDRHRPRHTLGASSMQPQPGSFSQFHHGPTSMEVEADICDLEPDDEDEARQGWRMLEKRTRIDKRRSKNTTLPM